jgi:hypothetical protein
MSIFQAIIKGLGTTLRKPRLVLILYVVNLAFAAVVAAPFLLLVQNELGHSFLGSNLRPVDIMWLGEAVLKYQEALPALLGGLAAAAALYFVLHIFLNGGIVGRLLDREGRTTLEPFFGDCGRYFWRFVRLFLVSLVFLVLNFAVILRLFSALFEPAGKAAATEWLPLILSNLHLLATLLLLSVVRMIIDYARIAVVADGERKVLRALRHALKFLGKRFFRAWAIYLVLAVLSLAGMVLFHVVFNRLGAPGVRWVVAGLVWMQIYVLFRIWVRTLFVAAQAEYYRAHPY